MESTLNRVHRRFVVPVLTVLLLTAGSLARASVTAPSVSARANPRPNILVILSDDMGYSDIGCYGGEIRTPNLDRLAKNGLRFTQFYNTARCCPTRASLLSGLYPHQAGVGHMMDDRGHDGYRGELNRRSVTIAEALKPAGYRTYMTGKWHITKATRPEGPKDNWPRQRGFDRFYGTITGAGSFYDPGTLTRDNTAVSAYADPEYRPKRYYYTDAISDHAIRYLREHRQSDPANPFFMYVAYTAAHWPMHALEEDIARYRGRYDQGYAPVRRARFERMKKLDLIDRSSPMSAIVGEWSGVDNKAWESRCMEVYAAMVDRMDQGIGRIVETLKATGQLENTLILYMQDNGGCAETVGRSGNQARAERPTLPAMRPEELMGGIRPSQTRSGYPVLTGTGVMPGPDDTYIAYGEGWANVSNTPFREYKHWVHEGGISTPLIAHWPRGIRKAQRNRLVTDPGHLIDVMATCIDLSGVAYPRERNGQAITPPEGISLRPAFEGRPLSRPKPIFWEHEGNRAVRVGSWKLVAKGEKGPWELYDLTTDRTEQQDLAARHPERVKEMAAQWQAWAERSMVLPLNPRPAGRAAETFSTRKRFELKGGDELPREQAPNVRGKGFALTLEITAPGEEGVLVAQGGSAEGYALYVQAGKPVFAMRHGGKLTQLAAPDRLPAGPVRLILSLNSDGTVSLRSGDRELVSGKVPGPLGRMPVDGLQVGRDTTGAVGPYTAPFPFTGRIGRVVLTVTE